MDRISLPMMTILVMLIPIAGETYPCKDSLLGLLPCLQYIAGIPKSSYLPPDYSCCRRLWWASRYTAGNMSQPCLCRLFRTPLLFGFPVEVYKIKNMMDYCHLSKRACEEGIEDGSPTPPPIRSPPPSSSSHPHQKASSSRGEGGSLIVMAVLGAICMAVEPIVMICSNDFDLRTAVLHFLNMLCYLLFAWYGLPNISDENVSLSVVNIIRAGLEVVILVFHIYKTPSRKEVGGLIMICTVGSLVFCSSFYYIEKSLNVDGKKTVFGYAPVGFSAILMIPPILDLRRAMVENPISIGYKDSCRIGGGGSASIICMLYGLNTSSPDYPTIAGGAVGIAGAVIQFIMILTVGERLFGGHRDENNENSGNRDENNREHEQRERREREEENIEDREEGYFSCLSTPVGVN